MESTEPKSCNTMRWLTPQRQKAKRKADKLRQEWRAKQWRARLGRCFACEAWVHTYDIHEIARGPHRRQAYGEPIAWLALCRECHDEFGDYTKWPPVKQYALKALRDPENYDRVRLNLLRGRQPDAISERDVWLALQEILT